MRHLAPLVALFLAGGFASAQEPAARVQAIFQNLISGVQTGDYASITIDGDQTFKERLTKDMVKSVHAQLGSRMKDGYSATFLTAMKKAGYEIFLWKLSFKDGKDDMLAEVFLNRDGKVSGFRIN